MGMATCWTSGSSVCSTERVLISKLRGSKEVVGRGGAAAGGGAAIGGKLDWWWGWGRKWREADIDEAGGMAGFV